MFGFRLIVVHSYEKGLCFKQGEFDRFLESGRHWFFDPLARFEVGVVDLRDPYLEHKDLDLIVSAGGLGEEAEVLQLQDHERALIWIDGRLDKIVDDGQLRVVWKAHRKVRIEVIDARDLRFDHPELSVILSSALTRLRLETVEVPEDQVGVFFRNGQYQQTLSAGTYAFWRKVDRYRVVSVPLTEQSLDISGQEIITADKVSLRLNALVTYKVVDPEKAVRVAQDARQTLYRDVQLALRALIGQRELDVLLADKEALSDKLHEQLVRRTEVLGLRLVSIGIRDIILPGDMKDLLNKVTEAKKAAEANLISRREETAAMRSQANTAKLLEGSPVLMRLRELEVLEKIATQSKLSVVLGEKGLTDQVVNLL
jgi:hypothetical protein